MTKPILRDEAIDFITRLCDQANAPKLAENSVTINAVGIPIAVDVSALPPGTLIDSYVTGEFFKLAYDSWVAMREPNAVYTDADVATHVRLGWHDDEQESDFDLIHMGE